MTEQPLVPKPKKKPKWYWNVLSCVALLWLLGGLNTLLLQDIPLLLFLLGVGFALIYPSLTWFPGREELKGEPLMSRRRLWAGLGGMAWVMFVLAVTFALLLFVIPPFAISPQTTYLTEPLATEFYGIDYQSVIEQQLDPGVPPEANGFRLLTETFGRPFFGEKFKDEHWHRLCQYLDLPTDIEPILTFTTWRDYEQTLEPEEQEIIKTCSTERRLPFSEEAIPIVRRWLNENDAAFDLFVVAIHKPGLSAPPLFDGMFDTVYVNDATCREMARGLQVRVRYRLSVDEIDKAWDDVLALYRIGEQHRRGVWNVMSSLIRGGITERANLSAESVMLHSDWTAVEIRRKVEKIMPFQQPLREEEIRYILRHERLTALYSLTHMANGTHGFNVLSSSDEQCCPRPGADSWFEKINMYLLVRTGIIMEIVNQRFDELEQWYFSDDMELVYEDPIGDKYYFLKKFFWYGHFGVAQRLMSPILIDMLCPAVEAWRTANKRQEAEVSLLRLVFALEAHHRDNDGKYPEVLDDLQGRYMDEIPLDPFSGESFRYILEDGGFLLYSVGPNGIDEEGRGYNDTPKGDDLRRRMPLR